MIYALQGDRYWLDALEKETGPERLRVHSVFKHAINLQDANSGKLYTLVSRAILPAPATIRLSCRKMSELAFDKDTVLVCARDRLLWNRAEITLENVSFWQCELPVYRPFRHHTVIDMIDRLLADNGSAAPSGAIIQAVEHTLSQRYEAFLQGWRQGDERAMQDSVRRCIGCGVGLTPSGDDMLIGLLAVLALPQNPNYHIFTLLAQQLEDSAGQTTDVSRAALLHARDGRFNQALTACLQMFFLEDKIVLRNSLKTLLSLGATSGMDMLKGMKTGLIMLTEREKHYAGQSCY